MGFYLQVPHHLNKAAQLVQLHKALIITEPSSFAKIPATLALICVVENIGFDAAGFAYDAREFEIFRTPDPRPRTWLVMDRALAEQLTGYPRPLSTVTHVNGPSTQEESV